MAAVTFEHADIAVDGTTVLADVCLDIADGEFIGIIGASGSGKTTFLRAVAGFSTIARGALRFDGVDVSTTPVAQRGIGMVFQSPALFARRSVRGNMAFPLELARREIGEIRERVGAEARALHLEHLLGRRADQLSRGEEQLVQIARTMVKTPRVLLLDEPLASLDVATRDRMRSELCMLQAGYGVTTLMSTNDPADATRMPSRLAVFNQGRLAQVGSVAEVRDAPATIDAAMTTGEAFITSVRVTHDRSGFWLVRDDPAGGPPLRYPARAPSLADRIGDDVVLLMRPEAVVASPNGRHAARVLRTIPGPVPQMLCDLSGCRIVVTSPPTAAETADTVMLRIERAMIFDPTTSLVITG